ncbi:hypothetical protein AB0O20_28605 [Streptomyces kronopolitis]|uniref:hypothetical protein n=1 Tax=Streptomyces kronopolitis TaxID=1612435 RepID=UPI0034149FE3
MSQQPYTDDDLKAEAARQHYVLTSQLNGRQVLSRMLDAPVSSTCSADGTDDGLTWDEALNCDQLGDPEQAITDLIRRAADVSDWAVRLGADGLEPEDHTLTVDGDDTPLVRLHLAFHPDLPDSARRAFSMRLARVMADAL